MGAARKLQSEIDRWVLVCLLALSRTHLLALARTRSTSAAQQCKPQRHTALALAFAVFIARWRGWRINHVNAVHDSSVLYAWHAPTAAAHAVYTCISSGYTCAAARGPLHMACMCHGVHTFAVPAHIGGCLASCML